MKNHYEYLLEHVLCSAAASSVEHSGGEPFSTNAPSEMDAEREEIFVAAVRSALLCYSPDCYSQASCSRSRREA